MLEIIRVCFVSSSLGNSGINNGNTYILKTVLLKGTVKHHLYNPNMKICRDVRYHACNREYTENEMAGNSKSIKVALENWRPFH